jgi:hypothetical protein
VSILMFGTFLVAMVELPRGLNISGTKTQPSLRLMYPNARRFKMWSIGIVGSASTTWLSFASSTRELVDTTESSIPFAVYGAKMDMDGSAREVNLESIT